MITPKSCLRILAVCSLWLNPYAALRLLAADEKESGTGRPPLYVEVRSSVDDLWNGTRKKKPEPHGKVYYIMSLKPVESEKALKAPVDEKALAAQFRESLSAQGFREMTADEKPDILLSVNYGRGFLKNPYMPDGVDEISSETAIANVSSADQVFAQRQIGYETKRQNAQLEKLFITVRALKYPESKQEKPKRLWQTTMILDNPDRHDINHVAKDMFLVGVQHFDRVLAKEGIVVSTADPKGRVIMAPLRVMDSEEEPRPKSDGK